MNPVLRYALLRLGLFAVVLVVLYLLGGRGVLLVAVAALLSLPLSLLLLRRQRDAMSREVDERVQRRARARAAGDALPADPDAAAEDAEDERRRQDPPPG